MGDFPLVVLTATVWTYWFSVGAMVVRLRKRNRKLVGLVPEQRVERLMWIVWVPLVAAWCALPYLALARPDSGFALPAFARTVPAYSMLRGAATVVAVASLLVTARCWARMGKDWRMDVGVSARTQLITDGMFRRVRHPIYALSIALMLCSLLIVPTAPMAVIAAVHIALMNFKARNEERHLLQAHGEAYRRYARHTGRFVPRWRGLAR
jgi:protein-S-isoprenylcysteine O-methyltransferase Ste14